MESAWSIAQWMTYGRKWDHNLQDDGWVLRMEKHPTIVSNSQLYATAPDGREYHYNAPMHSWEPCA